MFATAAASLLTLVTAGQPAWPSTDHVQPPQTQQVAMSPVLLTAAKPVEDAPSAADRSAGPAWKKLFDPDQWKLGRHRDGNPERRSNLMSLMQRAENRPSDQMLTSRCQALLYMDKDLSSSSVLVAAQDGWIVLQGAVASADLKERAHRLAAQTSGALGVRNELKVSEPTPQWFQQSTVTLAAPQQTQVRRVTQPTLYAVEPQSGQGKQAEPKSEERPVEDVNADVAHVRPPVVVLGTPTLIHSDWDLPVVKTYVIRRTEELQTASANLPEAQPMEQAADLHGRPSVRSYSIRVADATRSDRDGDHVEPTARFSPVERKSLRPDYSRDASFSYGGRPDVDQVLQSDPAAYGLSYRLVDGRLEISGQAPNPTQFYRLVDRLSQLPGIQNVSFGRDLRFAH